MCFYPGSPGLSLWVRALDHRGLSLIAANRRFRHIDPHLVGDLQLHLIPVDAGDLAIDAAGRDDAVVLIKLFG
jgi:hypothetical protein